MARILAARPLDTFEAARIDLARRAWMTPGPIRTHSGRYAYYLGALEVVTVGLLEIIDSLIRENQRPGH
jgi:hypothetical protein